MQTLGHVAVAHLTCLGLEVLELGVLINDRRICQLGGEGRIGRGGGYVSLVGHVRGGHVGHVSGQVRGGMHVSVVLM